MRIAAIWILVAAFAASPARAGDPAAPGGSAPAQAGPSRMNPEDFAARVALEEQEQKAQGIGARTVAPRPAPVVEKPRQPSNLLGLGISAALMAFGLVFGFSQRRFLAAVLRGKAPAPGKVKAPTAARPASVLNFAASRFAGPATAAPGPAARPDAVSDTEALRRLAQELQQTIQELRAERSRWEREWEQRELQLFRSSQWQGPREAKAPARPAPDAEPAPLEELENDSLPALEGMKARPGEPGRVLERVERLLAQGLSAEEVSSKLRVGLREIQWMMRLGALEPR